MQFCMVFIRRYCKEKYLAVSPGCEIYLSEKYCKKNCLFCACILESRILGELRNSLC